MAHVLILMTPAANDRLVALAERAAGMLRAEAGISWLAPDQAVEVALPDAPPETVAAWRAAIAEAIGDARVDHAIVPAARRRKRLLIADMDSTIIAQECLDEVADAVGIKPQVAAITERAMRGELDFAEALRERIGLLRGLPETALATVMQERISLTPGARTLVATMRAHGAHTILVSGGFTFFTGAVAARAGFHEHRGNALEFTGGKLTGVAEPILGREAKRETLIAKAAALGVSIDETLGVGDGANDLDMLQAAGLGVAFHAKPVVAQAADVSIKHCDLRALLYLQGYPASAFVKS